MGSASIDPFAPGAAFTDNVFYGAIRNDPSSYPPGNHHPQSAAEVGFVDFDGGDYALDVASPYASAASDGADIGADLDRVPAR